MLVESSFRIVLKEISNKYGFSILMPLMKKTKCHPRLDNVSKHLPSDPSHALSMSTLNEWIEWIEWKGGDYDED